MKLVAMVSEPRNIARFLSALGEPTLRARRADRCFSTLSQVYAATTVLEKHRSAPQGGEFQIRNKESGKLIGVRQGSTDDAAPVEQRGSGDGEEMRWQVVPAD